MVKSRCASLLILSLLGLESVNTVHIESVDGIGYYRDRDTASEMNAYKNYMMDQ
jgi:hypothetical protein